MKILVLNYEYPPLGGGAAPVCRDLALGMAKKGHQVTVVTMGFLGLPQYEECDGVEIYRLKCLRMKAHACMPWEQASYILEAKIFLKKHLRSHSYDVCHTHFVIPTGPIAEWIKERYKISFVITAHGSDVEGHNGKTWMKAMHRILRPAWRKIVREAYAVAAPSKYLLDLMNREMRSDKYMLIPNGLDIGRYRADCSMKEKHILLMGRMQESKNFQTVLKAVAMIPDKIWNDWHVDILGDGPYRETLEELCASLEIQTRVTFHGWIENGTPEQIDYLKRSAIYISASHFENCPMAVLEAVASGCWPLLSDIDGHRQFFPEENSCQYFFRADDVNELVWKIENILQYDPKGKEIDIDFSDYKISQITERYITLLENAVCDLTTERQLQKRQTNDH